MFTQSQVSHWKQNRSAERTSWETTEHGLLPFLSTTCNEHQLALAYLRLLFTYLFTVLQRHNREAHGEEYETNMSIQIWIQRDKWEQRTLTPRTPWHYWQTSSSRCWHLKRSIKLLHVFSCHSYALVENAAYFQIICFR